MTGPELLEAEREPVHQTLSLAGFMGFPWVAMTPSLRPNML